MTYELLLTGRPAARWVGMLALLFLAVVLGACDTDDDGFTTAPGANEDCDDNDPEIFPGAPEDCDESSETDFDCDGDLGLFDDSCCSLDCSNNGVGLTCGTSSLRCETDFSGGRPSSVTCEYGNGVSFECDYSYTSTGQQSGECITDYGGGDSCSF